MKKSLFILAGLVAILSPGYSQNVRVAEVLTYGRDRWVPFMTSNTVFNITNTSVEVTAISFTIPGGSMGANGALHITAVTSSGTSNINTKSMIFRYGGTVLKRPAMNIATSNKVTLDFYLFNRASESSQVSIPAGTGATSWTEFNTAPATFTINTAIDQTFTVGLSNAVASDSMNLEQFSLRVLRKP